MVAAMGDDAFPVKALLDLFALPATELLCQKPTGAYTRNHLTHWLQEDIMTLGVRGFYTFHSFLRGAATTVEPKRPERERHPTAR